MNSPNPENDLVGQVQAVLKQHSVPTLIYDHVMNVLQLHDEGRICSLCGCTEDEACVTDEGPCSWVRPRLCSACAQRFEFEHELPPLRAVYTDECLAADQDEAIAVFRASKPGHLIRAINGIRFQDPNRPVPRTKKF